MILKSSAKAPATVAKSKQASTADTLVREIRLEISVGQPERPVTYQNAPGTISKPMAGKKGFGSEKATPGNATPW
jgi:hypothetical protein